MTRRSQISPAPSSQPRLPAATMLGMEVELAGHVVVSAAAALPDVNQRPVCLSDDHEAPAHRCADGLLVPPPADLLIRGRRADQWRVVRPNVRPTESADGRDIAGLSGPDDRLEVVYG